MHSCVGRHFKKVQALCNANPFMKDCFSVRIFQVLVFGIFTLVLGAIAISKPGECSTPVQVFLEGLFGLYLFGFFLNLFVGFMYLCFRFNSVACINSWRNLQKAINLCYWPLHITFCMETNQQGAALATAMIVIWFAITGVCCIGTICFNGYVWQRDANELEENAKRISNPQMPPPITSGPQFTPGSYAQAQFGGGLAAPQGSQYGPGGGFGSPQYGQGGGFGTRQYGQGGGYGPDQYGQGGGYGPDQYGQGGGYGPQAGWDPNERVPGPLASPEARNQDPFYRSTQFNSTYNQPPGDSQSQWNQPGPRDSFAGGYQPDYGQYPPQQDRLPERYEQQRENYQPPQQFEAGYGSRADYSGYPPDPPRNSQYY